MLGLPVGERYYLNTTHHAYVGWNKNDDPHCKVVAQFESAEAHGKPDDVRVTTCDGAIPRPPQTNRQLVSCVAPVYGPLNAEWLAAWCQYHARLGVQHFDLYTVGAAPRLEGVRSYTWINASWQFLTKKSHERGQAWAMHDCLYRAHAGGDKWALFTDLDEWVYVPPAVGGLLSAIHALDSAGFDAVVLPQTLPDPDKRCGSKRYNFTEWVERQQALPRNLKRGHKSLVNAERVGKVNVHFPTGARHVQLSSNGMFLMHERCLHMHFGNYTPLGLR